MPDIHTMRFFVRYRYHTTTTVLFWIFVLFVLYDDPNNDNGLIARCHSLSFANNNVNTNRRVPQQQQQQQQPQGSSSTTTAVVLNTNARSVCNDLIPMARNVFGCDSVYVTSTAEEAQACARSIIRQRNVSLVIPVGGDGTVSSMMNYLCHAIIDDNSNNTTASSSSTAMAMEDAMGRLPMVGYIPLGTGNGLGSVVGIPVKFGFRKKYKLQQVRAALEAFRTFQENNNERTAATTNDNNNNAAADATNADIIQLPMMQLSYETTTTTKTNETTTLSSSSPSKQQQPKQQHEELCFFTGVGFDSLMLQDFRGIKRFARDKKRARFLPGFVRNGLSSVGGYTVALLTKTLPKCVFKKAHIIQLELFCTEEAEEQRTTLWVDHRRGDLVRPVVEQQTQQQQQDAAADSGNNNSSSLLLFKGTAGIVAASTTPYYGGKLRLFPFARITQDKMHLRIGRIHPLRGVWNIPRIFSGTYRDVSDGRFGCLDFIGERFRIEITSPPEGYPLQHSGESVGVVHRCDLRVLYQHPVKFVTFMSQRVIRCD